MTKNLARAAVGAALLAVAGFASAASSTTTVDAALNTFENGLGADSGIALNVGESFTVSAAGSWRNDPNPYYAAGPNGNTVQGQLGMDGLIANIGTLVGEIGNGPVFAVGSSFSGVAASAGELKFFFWDTDQGPTNNSGTVSASVSAVPEPTSIALMGLGLGLVALSRRRKL